MRWPERRRLVIAAGTAGTIVAVSAAWLARGAASIAATPTPEAAGDPRSPGQGPGLVGDPLTAILVVAGIGLLALVATLAWVRATGGPRDTRS